MVSTVAPSFAEGALGRNRPNNAVWVRGIFIMAVWKGGRGKRRGGSAVWTVRVTRHFQRTERQRERERDRALWRRKIGGSLAGKFPHCVKMLLTNPRWIGQHGTPQDSVMFPSHASKQPRFCIPTPMYSSWNAQRAIAFICKGEQEGNEQRGSQKTPQNMQKSQGTHRILFFLVDIRIQKVDLCVAGNVCNSFNQL